MGNGRLEEGMHPFCSRLAKLKGQVVVCVVADGRLKINPRTRSVLAALGVYQDGAAKNVVNGKPVVCPLRVRVSDAKIRSHICTNTPRSVSGSAQKGLDRG